MKEKTIGSSSRKSRSRQVDVCTKWFFILLGKTSFRSSSLSSFWCCARMAKKYTWEWTSKRVREIASVSMYTLPRSVAELLMNFLYYIKLLLSLLNAAGWLTALECVFSDGIVRVGGEMTKARYLRWKSSSERTFFIVSFFFSFPTIFIEIFSIFGEIVVVVVDDENMRKLHLLGKKWETRRNWWRKSSAYLCCVKSEIFYLSYVSSWRNKTNSIVIVDAHPSANNTDSETSSSRRHRGSERKRLLRAQRKCRRFGRLRHEFEIIVIVVVVGRKKMARAMSMEIYLQPLRKVSLICEQKYNNDGFR